MRFLGVVVVVLLVCAAPIGTVVANGSGGGGTVGSARGGVSGGGVAGGSGGVGDAGGGGTGGHTKRFDNHPPDPSSDVIGWEDGYWYNESINVNQQDGLSKAEKRRYVARAMARVEHIRNEEFTHSVTVNALSRKEYHALVHRQAANSNTPSERAWENQIWEALFVTGERADAARQQTNLMQDRVAGFYVPGQNSVYVISNGKGRIDNSTLIHELTHAMQDQHGDLSSPQLQSHSMDERRGHDGLTEGEANYVEERYANRCKKSWQCVGSASIAHERAPYSGGKLPSYNLAMQVALIQPYSDGPAYVASKFDSGGWKAVDRQYRNPPDSSKAVIHPGTKNAPPAPLHLGEQARNGWKLYDKHGTNGSQTVGEAGIYTMFWYQGRADGNPIIHWQLFQNPDTGTFDMFNYSSPPSDGWANDRLWPYHKGKERGYVWRTKWETTHDATQFVRAYRELLRGKNAHRVGPNTWRIPNGPFADAFRLDRHGRTVTVVNGPTVGSLSDIRPGSKSTAKRNVRFARIR